MSDPRLSAARTDVAAPREGAAGWWVAAIVALVALAGLVFLFARPSSDPAGLQAARQGGAADATLTAATGTARAAAIRASEAAQSAVDSNVEASEQAAGQASLAAQETAAANGDAGLVVRGPESLPTRP